MKIIVIGAGGHSKVIVDIIRNEQKYEIVGFIDNNLQVGQKSLTMRCLEKKRK
jgi:FlaA1/EpsC-like NDP-sugar epimerase